MRRSKPCSFSARVPLCLAFFFSFFFRFMLPNQLMTQIASFLTSGRLSRRYTFFIVLYPMGVTGELLTIYAALPYVQKTGLYSVTLPNKYNFSFDYYTFLILVMISYIPRKSAGSPRCVTSRTYRWHLA